MKLLAEEITDLFGTVEPPQGMNFGGSDPGQGFSNFITFGLRLFVIVAGLFLLIYLLWGAFDWINSGGEKERIAKAQNKITNALIGIVLIFVIFSVYSVLAGKLFGIIEVNPDGSWNFNLPSLK